MYLKITIVEIMKTYKFNWGVKVVYKINNNNNKNNNNKNKKYFSVSTE